MTRRRLQRVLFHAIALSGLAAIVAGVYVVIVLGLGRVPTEDEQALLVLSVVAAVVSALLWVAARTRVENIARRLTGGSTRDSEDVLRTFNARLTRALPLDEILLQLAEALREALALSAAEVWTGSDGVFERTVADPERGPSRIELTADDESVVVRAGVSGSAWAATWLPALVAGRDDSLLRVAPAAHAGRLLGLVVVERPPRAPQFSPDDERVLAELARQVGTVLDTARLDSALQATLEEVRRQSDELRASRARVVAAADAERRRIERDLHDGAQSSLIAFALKLRLARDLGERDAGRAGELLGELGDDVQRTIEELRDLAHGIYPPLLAERGLKVALSTAGDRASLPVRVQVDEAGRYPPEVETAVYFCCLEALQNAGKHAGPGARATVALREEEGALVLEIADDGPGFDPRLRGGGAGLANMADRIGAIGGRLRVESEPSAGTRVIGTIPL